MGRGRRPAPARFSLHPALGRRETAVSYLSRLSFLNARSFTDLKREVGIDAWAIECGQEAAVRTMATFCGEGHGALYRWTPRQSAGRLWSLHGHAMPAGSLDRTRFRVCPRCVLEDFEEEGDVGPYQRAEWLVSHVRSCASHAVPLEWCRPPKVVFQPYDFTRVVKSSLPELERCADSVADDHAQDFEAYVLNRLVGSGREKCWLDDMPLHVAATVCEVTGAVALFGRAVRRTLLTRQETSAAAAAGFAACVEGPEGLTRLLADVHDRRGGKGVWGARASIGEIHVVLDRFHFDPEWSAPVGVVKAFLLENVPFESGDVLFGEPVGQRRVHTIRSAVRASGTHSRTMRKLLVRSSLISEGELATRRDHHVTVAAANLDAMLAALRGSLSVPQVMARIGIPRLHLRHLIQSRALTSATMSVGVAWAKHRIDVAEIDRFVATLFNGAGEVDATGAPFVPLKEARQRLNCGIGELLDLVVAGRATRKARLRDRWDYGALLVDPAELRPYVKLKVLKSGLGRLEASRFLRIRPQGIAALIDAGHLETFVGIDPMNRGPVRRISKESAQDFRDTYVSLFELAASYRRHHMAVKADLAAAGIVPALDPTIFSVTLYPRREVAEALGSSAD